MVKIWFKDKILGNQYLQLIMYIRKNKLMSCRNGNLHMIKYWIVGYGILRC